MCVYIYIIYIYIAGFSIIVSIICRKMTKNDGLSLVRSVDTASNRDSYTYRVRQPLA